MAQPMTKAKAPIVNSRGKTERRRRGESRLKSLRTMRQSWHDRWTDLAANIDPKRGSFYESAANAANRGTARDKKIKDTTARDALRTLQNGMMSGATSPSRPWFRLGTKNDGLADDPEVKLWRSEVTKRMLRVLAGSNIYHVLQNAYGDLGLFGTAGFLLLEDFEDVVRAYPLVVGQFFVGLDHRLAVNTLGREFALTVGQIVPKWGYDNCSLKVQSDWDAGRYDVSVDICHLIEPNDERDLRKADAKGMAFRESYWEKDNSDDFLAVGGYHEFPAMIGRWDVNGNDPYGTAPGMDALPDVKQLHSQQVWKGKGIAKQVDPPLNAPASMKNEPVTGVPGGVNFSTETGSKDGLRAVYQVNLNLSDLKEDMEETRNSVRRAFYADLFFAISQMEGVQPRGNKEIEERKDEKFVQLGPVLERLHGEWLGPMVKRVYHLMDRAGLIPEKPEALQNMEPEIEFISVLAVAQKAVATVGIERLLQLIGQIYEAFPEAREKVDIFDLIDDYADFLGIDPRLVIPTDDAKASIAAQKRQAQQQQALEQVPGLAKSASDLANAEVGGGINALQLMTGAAV